MESPSFLPDCGSRRIREAGEHRRVSVGRRGVHRGANRDPVAVDDHYPRHSLRRMRRRSQDRMIDRTPEIHPFHSPSYLVSLYPLDCLLEIG